ncbi:malto-oligosyltrehalose trehalohydrolase [Devosia submarina]|uniref:malto-oligosyltrehalose trehalohydrolase n=1 Tax=Devosia submarina TaxID=1173082 RepID=UPI000D332A12|nr:malto-oligosyltrehalose trehalohydrolase [Devosia submarina]
MLSAELQSPSEQSFSFGPVLSDDGVEFRLWAPLHRKILLQLDDEEPKDMQPAADGWHMFKASGAQAGALYKFVLPDGLEVPDPGSRFQPQDVHGPSEVIDLGDYAWRTDDWQGRPWEEMVIYEMHVGSFTKEGTYRAAIDRLDHLQQLGVTALQIMPLSDFPGRYNWGYDGVLPYAPDSSYGRPEDLMALVDEAHARGISVFLDVVYNHFGPDGNYMPNYAPLFTDKHQSSWGQGINYDAENSKWVREFVIQNALYWITQFRIDGLRFDAVQAIVDTSEEHLLHEMARRLRAATAGRPLHLIVENEENNSDLLRRNLDGTPKLYTAQWNDDLHHVLHTAATGEDFGYYADYAHDSKKLARSLAEGFVFQGEEMPYRGSTRGKPSAELPPTAFVSFTQNHDQIGNRALGDRMVSYRGPDELKAIAAICLLAPEIPMLFMGEEWGAPEPFPYFCDFDEELNEKVRQGRRKELSRLPGFDADDLLDPTAYSTFASAKLDWSKPATGRHSEMLAFYSELLSIRAKNIVPLLRGLSGNRNSVRLDRNAIAVDWSFPGGTRLQLLANLSDKPIEIDVEYEAQPIFSLGKLEGQTLAPWTVLWGTSSE